MCKELLQYLDIYKLHKLKFGLDGLSKEELKTFWEELQSYGIDLLNTQREALRGPPLPEMAFEECSPKENNLANQKRGEDLIALGKVGCLILAGGQGSRLGANLPKGMVEVSPIRKKTLFQMFAERVHVLSKMVKRPLSLAIMTSSLNHEETVAYFTRNSFFGLEREQIDFFSQEDLPFLDEEGDWFLESPGKLAKGPNGNGDALHLFYKAELWRKWQAKGVQFLNMVPIDNVMADPFDASLVGFQDVEGAEIAIKAIKRQDPKEKVGLVVSSQGRTRILEYIDAQHGAPFHWANIGLFSFSLGFIKRLQLMGAPLQWHLAKKQVKKFDAYGPNSMSAWKFERFIFDVFPQAEKISVMAAEREDCYSPLKNREGEKSVQTVRDDLISFYKKRYRELVGREAPDKEFELGPAFYYIKSELGRDLFNSEVVDYVDVDL